MWKLARICIGYSFGILFAIGLAGCGNDASRAPRAPHDHHDHAPDPHAHDHHHDHSHPQDFPAAVAALRELYETIRDAFQANDPDKAHGPLHHVGHVIEDLSGLAAKAGLGEEELATVKSAAETMFEAYGRLDEAMHTGKKPDYAAEADSLEKAMADLQAVVDAMPKKAED